MNKAAIAWDSRARRRPDICLSLRGGIEAVIERSQEVRNLLAIDKDDLLLDVGCGDGAITNRLAPYAKVVVGIDASRELLAKGKATIIEEGQNHVFYLNSEATAIPFIDNSFDIVTILSAFHYFGDYEYAERVIDELIRVTKSSGRILITEIPSRDTGWYYIWRLIKSDNTNKEVTDFIEFEKTPLIKRLLARASLFLRRFTGKRVDSDDWLWYEKAFFQGFEGGKFKDVRIFPSKSKGMVNYRFDTLISNI